jgi:Phosphotransferase enzyme family
VEDVVVVQNSNTLALRLLPCDVFARTALVGQEAAAFEVLVAQDLGAVSAPIASLHPRVEPRVYEGEGFAVTFWTYYDSVTDTASPAKYANALHRLHGAMQSSEVEAPHFTERIAAAEDLLTNRHETPALVDADRTLLLDTLRSGRQAMCSRVNAEQLLHGEPHPGNLLVTRNGLLLIDLETCCRGPVEFDVAHAPDEVSVLYPVSIM